MKMVMAIVNNDDSHALSKGLTRAGFFMTKISSVGGFLRAGNTTFMMGVEDERVQELIDIIGQCSRSRTQAISTPVSYDLEGCAPFPVEVTVGGATVFVMNVDRFEKL